MDGTDHKHELDKLQFVQNAVFKAKSILLLMFMVQVNVMTFSLH